MINSPVRFWALIPCAGSGSRAMSAATTTLPKQIPKQYVSLLCQPLVMHTLSAFAATEQIEHTLVVLAPDDEIFQLYVPHDSHNSYSSAHCGGSTRAESVLAGLHTLLETQKQAHPDDWVLVHDAARCLITPEEIVNLIDHCKNDSVGGLLACPVPDTLKENNGNVGGDVRVSATLERSNKWLAQTPQMFRIGALIDALTTHRHATDEASAMEAAGYAPKLVPSSVQNFKVTYTQDFDLASAILSSRAQKTTRTAQTIDNSMNNLMNLRIGQGWDVHALVPGRRLMLGGIHIEHEAGLLGHSDADALLHAITDALLGGAALGDIGQHFPDTDPHFYGANSTTLLTEAARRVRAAGFQILNVDSTVLAQAPKLAPHIGAMRTHIAQALELELEQVSIKAKTAEKLGSVGQRQSIEAQAAALLLKITNFI